MFASRMFRMLPKKECFYLAQITATRAKKDSSNSRAPINVEKPKVALGDMGSKYQVFKDEDADVILDIYEERNIRYAELAQLQEAEQADRWAGINLERGLNGVFDIGDLVDVLRLENSESIFVASVPREIKYVTHICVVSGKSQTHMRGIAELVRKVYKKKMHGNDPIPILEGKDSRDWMALDLGNIALHIFSKQARKLYDLDLLWSVGPKYDTEFNKKDPIVDLLEQHTSYLHGLQPAS